MVTIWRLCTRVGCRGVISTSDLNRFPGRMPWDILPCRLSSFVVISKLTTRQKAGKVDCLLENRKIVQKLSKISHFSFRSILG
jgi:hypothetical protein